MFSLYKNITKNHILQQLGGKSQILSSWRYIFSELVLNGCFILEAGMYIFFKCWDEKENKRMEKRRKQGEKGEKKSIRGRVGTKSDTNGGKSLLILLMLS